ncbi:MAG TPA: PIN domain-containing protein [Candidatus Alectryocaccobium stercorigallinarum]|nr:PIN domain-containing protein [Candidatus Alectryocaccobium stercorigallinarum]
MSRIIEANVILRYLLKDDAEMSEKAKRVIEEGAYATPEIITEVIYVLKGVYNVPRMEIGETLIEFLGEINMENSAVVYGAIQLFSQTSLDFVDCILISRHKILGDEIISFDKKLNKFLKM